MKPSATPTPRNVTRFTSAFTSPFWRSWRERVDVGGHAGHDPARHLLLVVVDAEPLQVGEHLDPQRVEHAARRRGPMTRASAHMSHQSISVTIRNTIDASQIGPAPRHVRHAAVDPVPHEQRSGEGAAWRRATTSSMPISEPAAVAPDEVHEPERGVGPALGVHVHVRVGRRPGPSASTSASSSGVGGRAAPPHPPPAPPPVPPPPPARDARRRGRAARCVTRSSDLRARGSPRRRGRATRRA